MADYVIPPAENGAFFVATNVIITPNQTRGLYIACEFFYPRASSLAGLRPENGHQTLSHI